MVKKLWAPTYTSLADFWQAIENMDKSGAGCFVRFKFEGDWGPTKDISWCRAWCSYQNKVGNEVNAVNGSILMIANNHQIYHGVVTGGKTNYKELVVTWRQLLYNTV